VLELVLKLCVFEEQNTFDFLGRIVENGVGHVVDNIPNYCRLDVEVVGPEGDGECLWISVVIHKYFVHFIDKHSLFTWQTCSQRVFNNVFLIDVLAEYRWPINLNSLS
jgi:hypothetical protein